MGNRLGATIRPDQIESKEDATPAPERVQRLVYVLHSTDDDDIELMQQKWLRSDRWGTPSHASVRSFLNHSIAYADEKTKPSRVLVPI